MQILRFRFVIFARPSLAALALPPLARFANLRARLRAKRNARHA
jgi:hypothetical protein